MLKTNVIYFKFYVQICFTLLTGLISILPVLLVSAQTINSYEDFKLNCSKEAFYYNVQSPDCERYYAVETTPYYERSEMNRQFKQFYLQQLDFFKTALKLANEAHSIEQLQQARNYLNKTVVQLKKIPIDTEIHSSVWQTLTDAKLHLNNIDNWIGKETKAAEQLEQVKLLMNAANSQTKTATNLSDYQAAKAKWENVQQRLELIPLGLFYIDNVKTLQERVSEQVNSIQAQINLIIAQEQRHQEQVVQR